MMNIKSFGDEHRMLYFVVIMMAVKHANQCAVIELCVKNN